MKPSDYKDKNEVKTTYKIKELLTKIDGQYEGQLSLEQTIRGVSSIANNSPDRITFAENQKYIKEAEKEAKGVVLVDENCRENDINNSIKVKNIRLSYAQIAKLFNPVPYYNPGVDQTAVLKKNVSIAKNVSINSGTYIGENTIIEKDVVIAPGVKIGRDVRIGSNTVIHPNVVIERDSIIGKDVIIEASTVIGSEGYGYVFSEGKHHHIPQLGNVIIEDDVEIEAVVTIDRATQSSTVVKKGTKIDNQVQIGHNVQIGSNCLLVAHVAIGGSSILGDNVILAGRVAVFDHVKIGDNVKVGAASIVTSDIPGDSFYLGNPAQERINELKARALKNKLVNYRKEIFNLKKEK